MTGTALLKRFCQGLRAFVSAQDGNVAIIFALAVVPIVGVAGAAVDYSRANAAKTAMQSAADSSVLLAAKGSYASDSARATAGVDAFNANYQSKWGTASPTVTIASNTVALTAEGSVSTTVLGALGIQTIPVNVTSAAQIGGGSTACVLALQTSNDAIFVHGNASLTANCGLYSDSKSHNGIDFDGDSVTTASAICIAGTYEKDSKAKVTPAPETHCPVMSDPLASLPVPTNASAGCTYNGYKVDGNTTKTLNPGVYCGGIDIGSSAKVTFSPGNYIIRDGRFKIGSSAQVIGDGVFFYLTGSDAFLDGGSSSTMTFTAPTSGTYKGIVFFQSRTANTSNNRFGGSSNDKIQGAVYFPNGTAEIACNGTVGSKADYTVWVVKRLQIDSNAKLQVTSNYAGSATPLADGLSAMVDGPKIYLKK
ncbi:MAG: pilus assembly protein [Deltaproteobacteria bacterium]|nr:pilus assembly protein [Deltaproteobacteria bacterium]